MLGRERPPNTGLGVASSYPAGMAEPLQELRRAVSAASARVRYFSRPAWRLERDPDFRSIPCGCATNRSPHLAADAVG
jgi:hypothetical protein